MSEILTSAVFDVWRTLERMIGEIRFPALDKNRDGVMTFFGDPDLPPQAVAGKPLKQTPERVVVLPIIQTPDAEWGPAGRGAQEERFGAFLVVLSAVPGMSPSESRDRLEQLCRSVQLKLREHQDPDLDVSVRVPPEFAKYGMAFMSLGRLDPMVSGAPSGSVGRAEIELRCHFRINQPAQEA